MTSPHEATPNPGGSIEGLEKLDDYLMSVFAGQPAMLVEKARNELMLTHGQEFSYVEERDGVICINKSGKNLIQLYLKMIA